MGSPIRRWSPFLLALSALAGACARRASISVAATSIAPEALLLRFHARPGDVRRYRLVMSDFIHLGAESIPQGDSAQATIRVTEFVTESVTAVSGDTITVAHVLDSTRAEMPGFSLSGAHLDSLAPRGTTMVMQMDGRGRVLWARMEAPVRAIGEAAPFRALFPLADSSAATGTATLLLPERPVRVGAEWSDTVPCPRALRGCTGGMATVFRFERVDGEGGRREAVISSQADLPPTTVDTPMQVTSGPMHITGVTLFSIDAGRITGHTTTMTGTAHSAMGDLAMRMEMREAPVETAPAGGAAARTPARPPLLIRRAPAPTQTTIPDLIAMYRTPEPSLEIPDCTLPDAAAAAPAADWATLQGPDDGFIVRLPRDWRVRAPRDSSLGRPETVLEDSAGTRIRVQRVVTASGRSSLNRFGPGDRRPVELPHTGPCREGSGPAGSLWTFYAPDSTLAGPQGIRYTALGDVITAAGRRYFVTIGASSAGARDRMVRIIAGVAGPKR